MQLTLKTLILNSLVFSAVFASDSYVELNIKSGWNMSALPTDKTINYTDITNKFSQINTLWTYKDGKWFAYSPNSDISKKLREMNIKYMKTIESGDGFWIESQKSLEISFDGSPYSIENSTKLKSSRDSLWTLLGTGSDTTASNISKYHGSVNAIWSYNGGKWSVNAEDETLSSKLTAKGYDDLTVIKAGSGFWLNSKVDKNINTDAINPPSLPGAVELSTEEVK